MSKEEQLIEAIDSEDIDSIKDLIKKGANINKKYDDIYTIGEKILLSLDTFEYDSSLLKTLIRKKVNLNVKNEDGYTLLMTIFGEPEDMLYNNIKTVITLLVNKADPNIQDNQGATALYILCFNYVWVIRHMTL